MKLQDRRKTGGAGAIVAACETKAPGAAIHFDGPGSDEERRDSADETDAAGRMIGLRNLAIAREIAATENGATSRKEGRFRALPTIAIQHRPETNLAERIAGAGAAESSIKNGNCSGRRPPARPHEESHSWRDCAADERNGESGRIAARPLFPFFRIRMPPKTRIGRTD